MAILSAALSIATWVLYFARVPSGNVPPRPVGSVAAQFTALGLAIAGLATLGRSEGAWMLLETATAVLGLVGSSLFLWLLTQRRTPVGKLRVAVGDTLLPFEALTDTGRAFTSDELMGRRVLLKMFRGHW